LQSESSRQFLGGLLEAEEIDSYFAFSEAVLNAFLPAEHAQAKKI